MAFAGTCSKLLSDTEDVIGLAEALGVILGPKLNDALRAAIASEAQRWGTDALRVLTEVRKDIQCRFDDLNIHHSDDPKVSPLNDDARHRSALSENSSNSSDLSLPISSFRRATSLEQRLAANIFAAKYGESKGPRDETAPRRKETNLDRRDSVPGQLSPCSHSKQKRITFDPAIPTHPSNNDRLPSQMMADACEETATQQASLERVYGAASSSSSGIHDDTTLPTKGLNFPKSPLERASSLGSQGSNANSGKEFRREDSMAVVSCYSSRRSQSSTTSSRGVIRWKHEAKRFYDEGSPAAGEARGPARRIVPNVFKALGIIPWSRDLVMRSRLYQLALLCCLTVSTLNIVTRSFGGYSHETSKHVFAVHVDDVLALGAFLCFSAALWKSEALNDSSWLIESYLARAGRLVDANKQSCLQVAVMLLIWSLCVGSRLYANALALSSMDFSFAFNVFILLALCFYLYRMCYFLSFIVDDFCYYMQENSNFEKALEEFFLLHCTVRTACASLQACFVILQLTATVVLLFCSASIYFGALSTDWALVKLLPGLFCQIALLQLSLRASSVSDMCARVPMLINSANAQLSMERMYVVDYIVHCRPGFYIFEVRLNTAVLLKLSYVTFVAWCGLLTQGLGMHASIV